MKRALPISLIFFAALLMSAPVQAAQLTGLVSDAETSLPVANAAVWAMGYSADNGDSVFTETVTGKDGRYQFDNLPAGLYHAWCQHPDYYRSAAMTVQMEENTQATLDFFLLSQSTSLRNHISGHVYSTPPMLPAFIPLAGAKVWLTGTNGIVYHTLTDTDGKYVFKNIIPGIYTISAAARDHEAAIDVEKIEVTPDLHLENLDICLVPSQPAPQFQLSGTVYDKETKLPLHPAYITVVLHDPRIDSLNILPDRSGITVCNNEDGTYLIEKIPAGVFDVVCSARGYETVVEPQVDFTAQDRVLDFYLPPIIPPYRNLLAGTTFNRNTGDTEPWVDLTLTNLDGPEIIYHTHSDQTGYYQFHDILAGNYQITAMKRGFEPYRDKIEIRDNTWITDFDIKMVPFPPGEPVTLWGGVFAKGPNEIPVYPAIIEAFGFNSAGDSLFYSTRSNPDGSYQIPGMAPGYYMLRCRARGYETAVFYRVPLFDPRVRFDFWLTPQTTPLLGTISGRVHFDDTGSPVYKAQIHFIPLLSTDPNFMDDDANIYRTYTNERGFYKANLPPGKYIVSCRYQYVDPARTYTEYYDDVHAITDATPVPVREGQVSGGIDFGIPGPFTFNEIVFTGRVTDEAGKPLEKALVRVWELSLPTMRASVQGNLHSTYTEDNGEYKLVINLNLDQTFAPVPVYAFVAAACKEGYRIEFYEEKPDIYEAHVFWAISDTVFSDVNFTLAPVQVFNSISGTVTGVNGMPLANAFVLGIPEREGRMAFAMTDQNGQYTLPDLHQTPYYILYLAFGHHPEFYDDAMVWEDATAVLADGAVTGIDAELTPMIHPMPYDSLHCVLAGRIMNQHGNPLEGALVMVRNRDQVMVGYGMTDAAGYYQIDGLTDGIYEVLITKVNFASEKMEVEINSDRSDVTLFDFSLTENLTSIPDDPSESGLPKQLALLPNYPNPFNPSTKIEFALPEALTVNLAVFDILGRKIKTLVQEALPPGRYTVTWNGSDTSDRPVSSGVYFYVLETPGHRLAGKLILNR